MERTRYSDGIEVDQSDLRNTEDTKVNNILQTRIDLQHFGVVEGLEVASPDGITLVINPGRAYTRNGELVEVNSQVTGITGASIRTNVLTIIGLRMTEVTTTPKAHESNPVTEDTRFIPKPIAELFVASDASDEAAAAAQAAADSAALNDGNFVPLATMTGLGTSIGNFSGAILPRTKGGQHPNITAATNEQISDLQRLYADPLNDRQPLHSAEDDFHRSLIGSGTPSSRNAHGLALDDIGFDTGDIVRQARVNLTNGLIGLEPTENDYTPTTGSFAFSTSDAQTQVSVNGIIPGESVVINNAVFAEADFPSVTNVSFAGLGAGFYYILVQFGTGNALAIKQMPKTTLDGLCPTNNAKKVWLNNAQDTTTGEKQFFVIGCVNWDGTQFINLNSVSQLEFPATGDLVFNINSAAPFKLEAQKTLDLRRYGLTTTENIQKFTIRPDRLTETIVTRSNFSSVHDADAATKIVVRGFGTTPKHLTDNQARTVFGHAFVGGVEHALATTSLAGFLSATDKAKLDSLGGNITGRSLLKWSEVNLLNQKGEKSMADAAAVDNLADGDAEKTFRYVFNRAGQITNFQVYVGVGTQKNKSIFVRFYVFAPGSPLPTPFTITVPPTSTNNEPDRLASSNTIVVVPAPSYILVTREYQYDASLAGTKPRNLSVTCEYQFTL